MAMNFLISAAASAIGGSLFKGPKQIGQPADNMFDRLAKDFKSPAVADIFGAEAQDARDKKASAQEAKFDELTKATGVDIRQQTQTPVGAPDATTIGTDTGQKILKAVLAGKDPATVFGGI